jgi:hypothetical protein
MIEQSSKVLIIAGMHRSGTSVVAQWLHRCGLNIGEKLLGPGIGNVEGHFEDIDFCRYHQDVLEDNNLSAEGFVINPICSLSDYQEQKVKDLINFKNRMNTQWGWKEPRTCLFLKFYRKLIPNAYYLVVFRDFHSTVNSLVLRDFEHAFKKYRAGKGLSAWFWQRFKLHKRKAEYFKKLSTYYLKVWLTYNQELLAHLQHTAPERYMVVNYNSLLNDDHQAFENLSAKWHFDIAYQDFKNIFKPKLLSAETAIEYYIEDEALLKRSRQVQEQLMAYV